MVLATDMVVANTHYCHDIILANIYCFQLLTDPVLANTHCCEVLADRRVASY